MCFVMMAIMAYWCISDHLFRRSLNRCKRKDERLLDRKITPPYLERV